MQFWPHRLEAQDTALSRREQRFESVWGCQKFKPTFGVGFNFCLTPQTDRSEPDRAHDQYADKQLANPQKRICLIEFLHLGLVIVYQGGDGAAKIKTTRLGGFYYSLTHISTKPVGATVLGAAVATGTVTYDAATLALASLPV